MTRHIDSHRTAFKLAFLCIAASVIPAHAEDASAWSKDMRSAARLIGAASAPNAPTLRAGIEVKLDRGWKTYWRYPGDAGVPPRFFFTGSENLRSAKVLWPAPQVFSDESGYSIGYKDSVIFPLQVTPKEPGKPVKLRLKMEYGVCEKLCVPAEGRAELTLTGEAGAHDAALAAAEARVPKAVSPREAGLVTKRVTGGVAPLVYADVAVPEGKNVDLLVEGPNPEWALPIPRPAPGAPPGHRHFAFELQGMPPGVDPKGPFELTFTIVGADRVIETTTRLD